MLAGNICTKLFGCFVTGKKLFPFFRKWCDTGDSRIHLSGFSNILCIDFHSWNKWRPPWVPHLHICDKWSVGQQSWLYVAADHMRDPYSVDIVYSLSIAVFLWRSDCIGCKMVYTLAHIDIWRLGGSQNRKIWISFFSTINPTASEVAMAHAKNPKIHLKNE